MTEYEKIENIKPDPNQPRTEFNEEEIKKLAETTSHFKEKIVDEIEVDENNIIIRGERRYRASKLAGLDKIPIKRIIGLSKSERLERQLLENEPHSSLDRAWSYATAIININTGKDYTISDVKKMKKSRLTTLLGENKEKTAKHIAHGASELSRRIGIPSSTINMYLDLLELDEETRELVKQSEKGERKRKESMGVATATEITRIKNDKVRKKAEKIFRENTPSRKQVRKVIKIIKEYDDINSNIIKYLLNDEIYEENGKTFVSNINKLAKKDINKVFNKIKKDEMGINTANRFILAFIDAPDELKNRMLNENIPIEDIEREIIYEEEVEDFEENLPIEELDELKDDLEESKKDFEERMKDPKIKENLNLQNNWKAHLALKPYIDGGWLVCPYCGKPAIECLRWSCKPNKNILEGIEKASENYGD